MDPTLNCSNAPYVRKSRLEVTHLKRQFTVWGQKTMRFVNHVFFAYLDNIICSI